MTEHIKTKIFAICITVILAGLLTYWGIHGIGVYGMALFLLTPVFLGACPVVIYGRNKSMTMRQARNIGFQALAVYTIALFLFAMEGAICIAMAAPFGVLLTWLGTIIGFSSHKRPPSQGAASIVTLLFAIPTTAFIENDTSITPALTEIRTAIVINASPERVWRNVIEFPPLNDPTEFIFKTGIAYPINAEIEGKGIGAIRHCNFSTGSFVEPITIWNETELLKFDVVENPPPMKEISFYDINAPHLHDYFISRQGQFKLTKLKNGQTLLEGTTWYYHDIRPVFYWKLWSNYIIHKIHIRVLTHIKHASEKK